MARPPRSRRTRQSSSWSDLPPELLGVILLRLSIADRARLATVCRAWRSGARLQPLPAPPPWLILRNGTFLDLADKAVRRMPVPDDARCRGSVDDWLVLMSERSHRWYLMNPFSGATLPVPELTAFWRRANGAAQKIKYVSCSPGTHDVYVKKVAMSSDLSSSPAENPLLAAVICDRSKMDRLFTVLVCRPGEGSTSTPSSSVELEVHPNVSREVDIAFFKGRLYAVNQEGELLAVELRESRRGGGMAIAGVKRVARGPDLGPDTYPYPELGRTLKLLYLIPSGDRLLMVSRWVYLTRSPIGDCSQRTVKFEVFEAEFGGAGGSACRWEKAGSLRGRALFVGRHGSGSVPATRSPAAGGVREDCIYFTHQEAFWWRPENPIADSGVYDMREGSRAEVGVDEEELDGLYGPDAARAYGHGAWFPTWLFPAGTCRDDRGRDREDGGTSKRARRL
ncbi:hypothetical protein ACP70R_042292 [Stipagrostis hirtigluma subsp. patula]